MEPEVFAFVRGQLLRPDRLVGVCRRGRLPFPLSHKIFGCGELAGTYRCPVRIRANSRIRSLLYETNLSVLTGGSRSGSASRVEFRAIALPHGGAPREFSYVLVYSPQVSQHMGGLLLGRSPTASF